MMTFLPWEQATPPSPVPLLPVCGGDRQRLAGAAALVSRVLSDPDLDTNLVPDSGAPSVLFPVAWLPLGEESHGAVQPLPAKPIQTQWSVPDSKLCIFFMVLLKQ